MARRSRSRQLKLCAGKCLNLFRAAAPSTAATATGGKGGRWSCRTYDAWQASAPEVRHERLPGLLRRLRVADREVEGDTVEDAVVALADLAGELLRLGDDREAVDDLVRNELRHLRPLALAGTDGERAGDLSRP